MKITIAVACIAATLLVGFISCDWFRSSKAASFDITGKWSIDSVAGNDSSRNIQFLASVPATKDSLPVSVQFNKDSTFLYMGSKDSALFSYYVSDDFKSLFVKEDSLFRQLPILEKTDTTFTISLADSSVLHFRKAR
ncbi:MAG: hypothetical protein K0Q66_706 [Chitinophagaceae bacterium]|nr:hypothetical protein [Chitinophagaceae bacterium]